MKINFHIAPSFIIMTTVAIGYKSLQRTIGAVALPKINVKIVYLLGITAMFLMLVFYAYSINKLTGGSYTIKGYNSQISQLQAENNTLEASAAAAGFMGNVLSKARELGFEKTTQVKYIEVGPASLAQAK